MYPLEQTAQALGDFVEQHAVVLSRSTGADPVTGGRRIARGRPGSRHHVALGIVGSLDAPFGYYPGRKEQEELVEAFPGPWTIQRSTQFHEFASQI